MSNGAQKTKGGVKLVCQCCKNDTFQTGSFLLSTSGKTAFGLDFLNPDALCEICTRCGFIHWFHPEYGDNQSQYDDSP